jgi:hypothetical protein
MLRNYAGQSYLISDPTDIQGESKGRLMVKSFAMSNVCPTKDWCMALHATSLILAPDVKMFFALDDPVPYLVCKFGHGHHVYFSSSMH